MVRCFIIFFDKNNLSISQTRQPSFESFTHNASRIEKTTFTMDKESSPYEDITAAYFDDKIFYLIKFLKYDSLLYQNVPFNMEEFDKFLNGLVGEFENVIIYYPQHSLKNADVFFDNNLNIYLNDKYSFYKNAIVFI